MAENSPPETKIRRKEQMIETYQVAICQAERISPRCDGDDKIKENVTKNLNRYYELLDFICGGFLVGRAEFSVAGGVKLITFAEYAITGTWSPARSDQKIFNKKEIIENIAIRIPGEETDILAAQAKKYRVYIAAQNLEHDPEWPDLFFNTGFIIGPEGKIILKYRKTVTNVPIAMHCSAHDIMSAYKNPITKEYDPFPVVDTEIGRLAVMVCGDILAPEIPRVYAIKGADVVLHLTSGQSTSGGGNRPIGTTEAAIQTRAYDNGVYFVHSNTGPELGGYFPRARVAGYSTVHDYTGVRIAEAEDSNEQVVRAKLDIEARRRFAEQYSQNQLTIIRTELYAPYYNQPIYPANTFLHDGPIEQILEDKQRGYFNQAKENLKKCHHFYSEKDV